MAIVVSPLDTNQQHRLRAVRERTIAAEPLAHKLHCAYVPLGEVADVAAPHLYWAHGDFHRRPLTGVTRAELPRVGVSVFAAPTVPAG